MVLLDKLLEELTRMGGHLQSIPISPRDIVFEERIHLLCFHCKNYNMKFTCPPRFPKLDYRKIVWEEYQHTLLVYCNMTFTPEEYPEIRSNSTIVIQKALLKLEKILFENNIATPLSLIGGSCKLCKSGCPPDKCNNPYSARIPMEAIGINVVSTVRKVGIEIKFPAKENLYRCGLLLW